MSNGICSHRRITRSRQAREHKRRTILWGEENSRNANNIISDKGKVA